MLSQHFPTQLGVISANIDDLPERSELARLIASVARPFVLISDRELSVLRRGLTKEGWKRSLYLQDAPKWPISLTGTGLLSLANQWLIKTVRIPAPASRRQDFYCEDGAELALPNNLFATTDEHCCTICGKTYSGERYDAALRWYQHRALSTAALALALVYQIDKDVEYANKAAEIILGYADTYPSSCVGDTTGGMFDCIVDEAIWIIPLVQAFDLIYHSKALVNDDRERIERDLLGPVAQRLIAFNASGARELKPLAALGLIGCALKDSDTLASALYAFMGQLRSEIGDDGVWPESMCGQGLSSLEAFVCLAEACSRMGVDLYDCKLKGGKSLKSMFLTPANYAYPSFQLPALGDESCRRILPLDLYEVAYRRWSDEPFAWILRKGYGFAQQPISEMHSKCRSLFTRSSLYAFLFGRDLPGRVQPPRLASSSYPSIGLCNLRSESDVVLMMRYGKSSIGGHADSLGITLYANDNLIVSDYGVPGCGSETLSYYKDTVNHNTVVVDESAQDRDKESKLLFFRPGDYLQVAEADAGESYEGVNHRRRIILAGDVVLIQDFMSSDASHVYDWLLRCEGTIECENGSSESVQMPSECFVDAKQIAAGSDFAANWCMDGGGLAARLIVDEPGSMIAAKCPAETLQRTVDLIDIRRESNSARYLAVLVPYSGRKAVIERDGGVINVTSGNVTDWIFVADAPGASKGSLPIETDAKIATVREIDGKMVACGLYRGSYIKMNGEMILLGSGIFDWVEVKLDSRNPIIAFQGCYGGFLRLKCGSRAMRVNGHRISATTLDGMASIRIVGVLAEESLAR